VTTTKVFIAVVSLTPADMKLKPESHYLGMSAAYLASASRMFLEGSHHATPMAAVAAGERSLHEWCNCLSYARFLHADELEPTDGFDDLNVLS
jgi:hypothetical protein